MGQGNQFNRKGARDLARRRVQRGRRIARFHRISHLDGWTGGGPRRA